MKLSEDTRIPAEYDRGRWADIVRNIQRAINLLVDYKIDAFDLRATSAPSTGSWKQGDFVPNSTPTELGSGGSKYTIAGWRCVASGSPGTWVQVRDLTGN